MQNIICNADPPAVYENLLNKNNNSSFLFKWKKSRMGILWVRLLLWN